MLDRFSRPEMDAIWTTDAKFKIWLEIQSCVAEAQAELGVIPKQAAIDIREKGNFDIARVDKIEETTRHDVIAYLTNVAEYVGDNGRFLHQGMTSSDMIDTGFSVQLGNAADLMIAGLDELLTVLKKRIKEHKNTPCIGRSHGIHAEPTSFGLKLATHYAAFKRGKARLIAAKEEISTCAISGAVGTFATIDPLVEASVADKLGLQVEPISTQIIPRDRHANFVLVLSTIASSIENLATEIRHLQRTEVREVAEFFVTGQKGSSAMPHKRNPILTENLTGLARIARSYVIPALENITLWHERDISHSSAERIMMPDVTAVVDFALHRLIGVVDKLIVYPERMEKNLNSLNGLVFSQVVLLALTQKGMSREDAYKTVQTNAMKVWDEGADFKTLLTEDSNVARHLSADEISDLFQYDRYLKHVDTILERTL